MLEGLPAWVGGITPAAALMLIALLSVTGKLVWHTVPARREADIVRQRDEALSALRDALEINRIHAEGKREFLQTLDAVADGQAVILKIVQALPRPNEVDA